MPKIKICAVQFEVSNDFNRNLAKIEPFFKKAKKIHCHIICFPEIFITGPLRRQNYNPNIPAEAKKLFSKLSKSYGMHAVMGSIIEKIGRSFYNISYLFDDKGKILGSYRKNHLVLKSEAKWLKSGKEVKVFKTKLGNIGIQICRDLLYPEVTRKLMLKKADVVFCPSYWCSKSSSYDRIYNNKYFKNRVPDEVAALVSARAIESETIFVYSNAAGKSENGILLGKTRIALPFYGTTDAISNNKEGILAREIDLSIIRDARKVYRIEKDMKGYYS